MVCIILSFKQFIGLVQPNIVNIIYEHKMEWNCNVFSGIFNTYYISQFTDICSLEASLLDSFLDTFKLGAKYYFSQEESMTLNSMSW